MTGEDAPSTSPASLPSSTATLDRLFGAIVGGLAMLTWPLLLVVLVAAVYARRGIARLLGRDR